MSERRPALGLSRVARRETAALRAVIESMPDAIVILDDDGRVLEANPAAEHVLGATREELLGRRAQECLPAAEPRVLDALRRHPHDGGAVRGGFAVELPNGGRRWMEYTATTGILPGRHAVIIRDGTETRRTQEALELRAAQQAAIAELGLLALGRAAPEDLMRAVVTRVAEGLSLRQVAIIEGRAGPEGRRVRAAAGGEPGGVGEDACAVSVPIMSRGATWGSLEARDAQPLRLSDQDVDFLRAAANTLGMAIGAAADEKELRRRSAEIARLAEARERVVAEALAAEDHARERISQQLHDELLQSLFVIRQDLAQVVEDPERTDLVTRARDALHDAICELRAAVVDIHPVVLERSGLRTAVRAVAEHHAQLSGLAVAVEVAPEAEGEHARLLLSLARELLANVARHAQATRADVRIWRDCHEVVLEVSDDGRGIDLAGARLALEDGHIGLASAATRVEALRGRLVLSRRPGGGTIARAAIPLSEPEPGE